MKPTRIAARTALIVAIGLSFGGLAFITGSFGASTFIPPGKVSDFFGFQYMRDLAARRYPMISAFHRQLSGDLPSGSAGLNRAPQLGEAVSLFFPPR